MSNIEFEANIDEKTKKKILEAIAKLEAMESVVIDINIPGEPKAWQRHRARLQGGKTFVGMYDPNVQTKKIIRDYIVEAMNEANIDMIRDKEIVLEVYSYRKIPKSMGKAEAWLYEHKYLKPQTKPDADNYAKLFMDAANNVLWDDDKLVVSEHTDKFLSFNPRLEIKVTFKR